MITSLKHDFLRALFVKNSRIPLMVADMKVDKVAGINININLKIQFGERVGHGVG